MKKRLIKVLCAMIALLLITGTVTSNVSEISAEGENTTVYAGNPFYGGWSNCTWSAWQLVYESTGIALPRLGNAGEWAANAVAYGYYVSSIPAANSIIVWSGHVGYVTAVSEDGASVYVQEGGFSGGYHEGWYTAYSPRFGQALLGYIYLSGEVPAQYYKPNEVITPVNDVQVAELARKQQLVKEEEEKVTIVEDAVTEELSSQKSEELDAIDDIKEEEKTFTIKQLN